MLAISFLAVSYSLSLSSGLSITSAVEIPVNKPLIPPPVAIAPTIVFATSTLLNSPSWVKAYVEMKAKELGVNPVVSDWIVRKESQYGQNMDGDGHHSWGYFQISNIYHPEVSSTCAMDLECSTAWSLQHILDGKVSEWSAFKYCKKWWPDSCPL